MKRNWWIAVVAAVGIILAILLFPRPDTGGDPLTGRVPRSTAATSGATADATEQPRPAIDLSRHVPGPRPEAAEMLARRATPEAVYANLLVGPVAGMKYNIRKIQPQTGETPALQEKIDSVVTELRAVRDDPAARPWTEIEATVESLITMVSASSYGSDPDVQKSIARARTLMSQYHTDPHGTGGTTPTGEPMPSTSSMPSSGSTPTSGTTAPSQENE